MDLVCNVISSRTYSNRLMEGMFLCGRAAFKSFRIRAVSADSPPITTNGGYDSSFKGGRKRLVQPLDRSVDSVCTENRSGNQIRIVIQSLTIDTRESDILENIIPLLNRNDGTQSTTSIGFNARAGQKPKYEVNTRRWTLCEFKNPQMASGVNKVLVERKTSDAMITS